MACAEHPRSLGADEAYTKRPVVVYEGNHRVLDASFSATMAEKDLEFFMDVLRGLSSDKLDLILSSYGGSPDAADMIGSYLRQKFTSIRVFVPLEAMSAATMLACGANSIVMGRHSFLGPIDLQMRFATADGPRVCAAQDVLDQYGTTRADFGTDMRSFWDGPGSRYWPDTVVRCENALKYGREVAERGLAEVMFRDEEDGAQKAQQIAADLADHQKHRAHQRRLSRTYLRDLGMKIEYLEDDDDLQDLVLTIHHLCSHWFEHFPVIAKTVQSSRGRVAFDLDVSSIGDAVPQNVRLRIYQLLSNLLGVGDADADAGAEDQDDAEPAGDTEPAPADAAGDAAGDDVQVAVDADDVQAPADADDTADPDPAEG